MLGRALVTLASLAIVSGGPALLDQRDENPPRPSQGALKDTLVALEKQSWQAWQRRDSAFFQNFLSDDHVEVGFGGITGKRGVVAGVGSPACVVQNFSVDSFSLTQVAPTVALLTYRAAQSTLCGGHPVPSPVWATSVYVRRDNRWLNALYQQTQTAH